MNKISKKASVFVYILILINVALIIWYVVFNNINILSNNINISENAEELSFILSDKWDINIESVKKYNSNGDWFADFVSCPTNITMSWTTNKEDSISSHMVFSSWSIYCSFMYTWTWTIAEKEWRILFDENNNFSKVYYNDEIREINNAGAIWDEYESITIDSSSNVLGLPGNSIDNNVLTEYKSMAGINNYIKYKLDAKQKLAKIVLKKLNKGFFPYLYWGDWILELYDKDNNLLESKTLVWMEWNLEEEILLWYSSYADANEIQYIKIIWESYKFLDIAELEIYKLDDVWGWTFEADSEFAPVADNTLFSFDSTWIWWLDDIDDNMNSDNYRVTSSWGTAYSWSYIDDDTVPRLTIFWSVQSGLWNYFNIFWNNYKTDEMIKNNTFNDDLPNLLTKIWDVTEWYLFFDFFSKIDSYDYDIKIVVFDEGKYENEYTLLPTNTFETKGIGDNYWYLQLDWDSLSLSRYKTTKEFKFDFKNNDYALFLKNNSLDSLAYKITWEESDWQKIYINPIDDSENGIIETIANHLLIWWDKNFIWENLKIVWEK